ncbi:MAG: DNA polymerase I [Burkholderiaceae bacterium]
MDMTKKTLLLVDGSSYLFRAFHALPDLRNKAGEPTGAIYGMVGMLRRLRTDSKLNDGATLAAVVFDAPGKTFRDDIYDQYKANRAPTPDDLRSQIPLIHDIVQAMGWPLLMIPGVEADDVIGTLAEMADARGIRTLVSTGDKDMAQLVHEHTTLFNTMTRDNGPIERLDAQGVREKFGVPPERIVDYLALVGDTVDNVPGVSKCGPKTAVKWLSEYGSLDEVIAHAHEIKGVVGQNLRDALEWLPTARELVTIRTDVALPEIDAEFEAALAWNDEKLADLRDLFARAGFRTWLKDVEARLAGGGDPALAGGSGDNAPNGERDDAEALAEAGYSGRRSADALHGHEASITDAVARAGGASASTFVGDRQATEGPSATGPKTTETECVLEMTALDAWLERIQAAELTAFDTETTSLDPMQAEIVGVSLSVQPGLGCYIPLAHRYPGAPDQLDRDTVLERLRPWLTDESKAKVGQNLKYDMHVLENHGIRLAGVAHDTLLQSYVLEAHRPHDMDSMARRHLDRDTILYTDVAGKGARQIGFDEVALEQAAPYAAEDADVTLQLHGHLFPQIAQDDKLAHVYGRIEMPTMRVLQRVERNGVLIDPKLLEKQSHELGIGMQQIERKVYEVAGQPFNINSPKQLGEILFGKLELPVIKKTASGGASTDEDVLTKLAEDYPLPKLVLDYRGLSKLKSTYTDKLPKMIHPRTGRVHTNYAQATAVTGRLASTDPNLQNIPVRTAEGRRIREAFIAPEGSRIVSCDYSQIELRIMAHISGDEGLRKAFAEGLDVHKATAAEVFSVPLEQVDSEQRRVAKVINFGLIYGMSAFGLASNLGIERDAAKTYIDRYFSRYPGVAEYMARTRELAKEQGYVETVFGRRLWLAEIRSPNGPRRQAAERAAINAPMQGTAADLIKMAMVAVQDWLEAGKMASMIIMQVHDELVFEVPQAELEAVTTRVPELMCGVAALAVPLVVEPGVGVNWEAAH